MSRPPSWKETLLDEIAKRPRVLVVLDFDGTLVPIRARPGLAALGAQERWTLRQLNRGAVRVAMMSGRAVADLRKQVGVADLLYGGVFGLEIAGPGWRYVHPKARAMKPVLASLVLGLKKLFADVPGVHVEDKQVGLCVHFRAVEPERRREFERRLAHARAAAPRGLQWRRGRCSWEVRPQVRWDKGSAAKLLWRRMGRPYLLVIGDEHFDEAMFRVAHKLGASVRVGRGSSQARHRLRNPDATRRFLRGLAERTIGRRMAP